MNSLTELDPSRGENFALSRWGGSQIGLSDESRAVAKAMESVYAHFLSPNLVSEIIRNPVQRFYSLKIRWQNETRFTSDTNEICTHEAYQKIIGMGEKALPFIYKELKDDPDYWFWALKAITDEDPVPVANRGDIEEMTRIWLEWLEEHFAPVSSGVAVFYSWPPRGKFGLISS